MATNPFKNSFVVGITSGLIAAALAPVLLPALKRSSRPIAKGVIKGGMALYEKGREVTAHTGEMIEDVMAEIQGEEAEKETELPAETPHNEEGMFSKGNSGHDQKTPTSAEEGGNPNARQIYRQT